ncbi:hypothetical protein C8Q77DRAFT_1225788 [Trametes polyzona]|nr:hypothetical protein C8Q77DRAFT_1225788 [Trametes polyzona]
MAPTHKETDRSQTEPLLPYSVDDIPLRPHSDSSSQQSGEDGISSIPPKAAAAAPWARRADIHRVLRRVRNDLFIALCLVLWCTFISLIAACIFGGIGGYILQASHPPKPHEGPAQNPAPSKPDEAAPPNPIAVATSNAGTFCAFVGCAVFSIVCGAGAHAVWVLRAHLRADADSDEEDVEVGSGHPLAWPLSLLAFLAGGFAPALGVALYPQHVRALGVTALVALKVYATGLGFLLAVLVSACGTVLLAMAVCGGL